MILPLLLGRALAAEDWREAVELSGFVNPGFSVQVRDAAVPEDQLDIGITGSRAGLVARGEPVEAFSYKVYLLLKADTFPAVTSVRTVDVDNDGKVDGVDTATREAMGNIVREASLSWNPSPVIGLKMGRMPIPFTSQAQSADTALLFPERSGPNSVFIADQDLGGLVNVNAGDVLLVKAGVFDGASAGALSSSTRGALYLARVDLHPLGEFEFDEGDPLRSDLRLGLGGGLAWHPYTAFDSAGYQAVSVNDLRATGSLRVAVSGLSAGAEVLWRQRVDDLTSRPQSALGAYGQLGFFTPVGLEPIARVGWTEEDRSFDPQATRWMDLGLNIYPFVDREHPDVLRLTAQYVSENRVTEGEAARGGALRAQLTF